jgi:hypothetical protein
MAQYAIETVKVFVSEQNQSIHHEGHEEHEVGRPEYP